MIPTKELAVFKREVSATEKYVGSIKIKSLEDYEAVASQAKLFKKRYNSIVARKEEITKPMLASIKSVRDLFRPLEESSDSILTLFKNKMLDWHTEEKRKADLAQAKLTAKIESGKITLEKALDQMVDGPVKSLNGTAQVSRTAYRVTDKTKVPLDFMEVDMVKVRTSFTKGIPVPGVEAYEVSSIKIYGN